MQEFTINHSSLCVSDEEESDDIGDQANTEKNEKNAAKYGLEKEAYARLLKQMRGEEVPNFTELKVDFNEQLNALKRRTEKDLPYTVTQVNDVMYLDQFSIVAFEYHCYQPKVQYNKLGKLNQHINAEGVLVNQFGIPIENYLRTHEFQKSGNVRKMSNFKPEGVKNYADTKIDFIKQQLNQNEFSSGAELMMLDNNLIEDQFSLKLRSQEMQSADTGVTSNAVEPQMLQGVLSTYLVNPDGGLNKKNEVDMKIARMFQKPKAGNMTLTRSKCKQLVSVTSFERYNNLR